MNTKLKIDLTSGLLEVEGSEEFVKEIYTDFKEDLDKSNYQQPIENKSKSSKSGKKSTKSKSKKSSKKTKSSPSKSNADNLSLVSSLNLYPEKELSLKEFVGQFKKPKKKEIYLLIIHYLDEILNLDEVTVNHIYTCLKELNKKVPTTLAQQMRNLSNKEGWINTSNMKHINVTVAGDNYINFEMKKKNDEE